jgi:hypothetical protein
LLLVRTNIFGAVCVVIGVVNASQDGICSSCSDENDDCRWVIIIIIVIIRNIVVVVEIVVLCLDMVDEKKSKSGRQSLFGVGRIDM